jgi:hypothetical protein
MHGLCCAPLVQHRHKAYRLSLELRTSFRQPFTDDRLQIRFILCKNIVPVPVDNPAGDQSLLWLSTALEPQFSTWKA